MADDALTTAERAIAHALHLHAHSGWCDFTDSGETCREWSLAVSRARVAAEACEGVVREHTAAKQAEALREASRAIWNDHDTQVEIALGGDAFVRTWLHDRADSLHPEPAPDGGER